MNDLYLCGWRVRSELPLPELAPWTLDDRSPDITIRLGPASTPLRDAIDLSPLLQVRADGAVRLTIEAVASYLLQDGNDITIEPAAGVADPDVRVFLLGTIFGLLCHWRGLFPLHASCVRMAGGAVAFSGASGVGKSTLAATLARRGHALLSDDVCVIAPFAAGGPVVLPAFPRVKLWHDSLHAVGIDKQGLESNRPGQSKFHFRFVEIEGFTTQPVPLRGIYFLTEADLSQPIGIERLRNIEGLRFVHAQIYRRRCVEAWRLGRRLFEVAGEIASKVGTHRLTRSRDLAHLEQTAAMLEAHVGL